MKDLDKIIRTLDLSQSDAREETLIGIVKYVISIHESNVEEKSIPKLIKKEFKIDIHEIEIKESIKALIDENIVEKDNNGFLKLSKGENLKLKKEILKIDEERSQRFKKFTENIIKISDDKDYAIVEDEISILWENFRLFIYDCYLSHGKNAVYSLTDISEIEEDGIKKIYKKYSKKIPKKLDVIFKEYIKIYPKIIDSNILNYLTTLANKTEAFYSLGLSKEEYNQVYSELKFDWIIFVDTNFLYSILDLHNHPEDMASKFVLELGTEMGIKFKFMPKTYEELSNRKKDFEKDFERNLRPSQIEALVESEKLDSFAQSYYQKKINDPINTPHPTDIIKFSQNILKQKKLDIYQSKFEALSKLEDYLLDRESKYADYLALLDEARVSQKLRAKGRKDPIQIQHDIFLREAILFLRKKEVVSISEAKYFGVTLDKALIKFDSYTLRKESTGNYIPTFFKPSLLLKKLLKHSPVKTEDYLRAFVSTISTPALDDNSITSKIALRSMKYFHKMGIDNKQLILNCIKDELFLKNFEENELEEEQLKEFIESKINQQINETSSELKELESKYKTQLSRANENTVLKDVLFKENTNLQNKLDDLNNKLELYQREIKKVHNISKSKVLIDNQLRIDEEAIRLEKEEKTKSIEYQNEKLINKIVENKIFERKRIGWLFLLIGIIILAHIFLVYFFQKENFNYVSLFFNWLESMTEVRKNIAMIFITLVIGGLDYFLIKGFYKRVISKKALNNYRKEQLENLNKHKEN